MRYYPSGLAKNNETGRTCCMYEGEERCIEVLVEKYEGKGPHVSREGGISKWILMK